MMMFRPITTTIAFMVMALVGCTHLFMQPDRLDYALQWVDREDFVEDHFFATTDGLELHGWLMREPTLRSTPKALIVQLHGNAQNLTAHYHSVIWLIEHDFEVFTFDYRGYGMSEGKKDIKKALVDIETALLYAAELAKSKNLPLVFYGQSLGGSLLLKYLQDQPQKFSPKLVIIESSFYSFPGIAREKLASTFITWPFQWLADLTVSGELDPGGEGLQRLKHLPTLLIYSERDAVVPIHHGLKLFGDLQGDKTFWAYREPGHVAHNSVNNGQYGKKLAHFIGQKLSQ